MILEWHEGEHVVTVHQYRDDPAVSTLVMTTKVALSPLEVTVFQRIAEEARHE